MLSPLTLHPSSTIFKDYTKTPSMAAKTRVAIRTGEALYSL